MRDWIRAGVIFALLTLTACSGGNCSGENCSRGKNAPKTNNHQSHAPTIKSPNFKTAPKILSSAVKWQEVKLNSPAYHFLVGGYEAMAAAEYILQTRYNNYAGELPMLPGGGSKIPFNPNAKFDPAFIEIALKGALVHLQRAQKSLERAVDKDFAVTVNLAELWLDINANRKRDKGEDLMSMLGDMPWVDDNGIDDKNGKDSNVRFDTADANWLAAYTHVLAGSAELILSIDPTPAIKTITDGRKMLDEKGNVKRAPYVDQSENARQLDTIATVLYMLEGDVDAKRTRLALAHFQAMIKHNQAFWSKVALETDNDREWLPNSTQTSAFGGSVSAEIAEGWQNILSEISDILDGKTLIPYWRIERQNTAKTTANTTGVNLNKFLKHPTSFDAILLVQGTALAPFIEKGTVTKMDAIQSFARLTGGRSGLFAIWLN
ncbi:MAG: hypothetical protein V3U57_05405 [Robiginitomaculum sp.]